MDECNCDEECYSPDYWQRLRTLFLNFGIPESIVTDNGPQFAATEFKEFCRSNGIRHILIAPYHPGWPKGECRHLKRATTS